MSINEVKFALSVIESKVKDEACINAVGIISEFLETHKGESINAFISETERACETMFSKMEDIIAESSDDDLYSLRGLVEFIQEKGEDLSKQIDEKEEEFLDASEEDVEHLEEELEEKEEEPEYSSFGDDDDFDAEEDGDAFYYPGKYDDDDY